jgi:hypothetical protein
MDTFKIGNVAIPAFIITVSNACFELGYNLYFRLPIEMMNLNTQTILATILSFILLIVTINIFGLGLFKLEPNQSSYLWNKDRTKIVNRSELMTGYFSAALFFALFTLLSIIVEGFKLYNLIFVLWVAMSILKFSIWLDFYEKKVHMIETRINNWDITKLYISYFFSNLSKYFITIPILIATLVIAGNFYGVNMQNSWINLPYLDFIYSGRKNFEKEEGQCFVIKYYQEKFICTNEKDPSDKDYKYEIINQGEKGYFTKYDK